MKRDGHSAKRKILPLFLCLLLSLTMVPTVALAEDGRSGDIPSGNVSAAGDGAKGGALAGPDAQGGSSDGAEGEDIGGSGAVSYTHLDVYKRQGSGLVCGKDFYLGFSPERVDPGNLVYKTKNTPKVVGAIGAVSYTHLDVYKRQTQGCP